VTSLGGFVEKIIIPARLNSKNGTPMTQVELNASCARFSEWCAEANSAREHLEGLCIGNRSDWKANFIHLLFDDYVAKIQLVESGSSDSGHVPGCVPPKQVEFPFPAGEVGCPRVHVAPQSRLRRCWRIC